MTRTSLEQRAAEIVAKLAAGVVRPPLERIEQTRRETTPPGE